MADDNRQLVQYVIDLGDSEAKVARLQSLIEQVKAKLAAGEDAGALEAELAREAEGLSRVTRAQVEGQSATEGLANAKGKLASVVGLVGGQFGALVSRIGSLIQIVATGNPIIMALAAALAVVGSALNSVREQAGRAEDAIRSMMKAQREGRDESLSLQGQIANRAAQAGVMGGAVTMARQVSEWAHDKDQPVPVALGTEAAIAAQIHGVMTPDLRQKFLAGLIVAGGPPKYATGPDELGRSSVVQNRELVERYIQAGGAAEAQDALRAYIGALAEDTKRTAPPPPGDPRAVRLDTIEKELADTWGFNARDIEVARGRAMGVPRSRFRSWPDYFTDPRAGLFPSDETTESEARGDVPGGGATRTFGMIEDAVELVREQFADGPNAERSGPIVIQRMEITQQSIGTQNNGMGNRALRRMKNGLHPWGGSKGMDIRATN